MRSRAGATAHRPTVAISLGDPYGIGPEVLAVALSKPAVLRQLTPIVFGDAGVLAKAAALRGVRLPRGLTVESVTDLTAKAFRFGRPPPLAGRAAVAYLEAAVTCVKAGRAAALCTGPIHKERMVRAGFRFTGHTDYLCARFGARRVVMMLAGPTLRVALATVHIPLAEVPGALTTAGLVETLAILHAALRDQFGIRSPRLAVTGLNPHAGEGGLLGTEEARIIAPAIRRSVRRGLRVFGPFPADSLFARQLRSREFDAILAMTHDQGLGPLKAVDFERAVNVTLGLPVPRTSPDHGVADDIAGRGIADPTSTIEALLLAAKLASRSARR